jgi:hypothetical protein
MKKHSALLATATVMALAAGQAFAIQAPPGKVPVIGKAESSGGSAVVNPLSFNIENQDMKVVSSNGVRIGTVVSTTTGADGAYLTVRPTLGFMTPREDFQVPASATMMNKSGDIVLKMSDSAVRMSLFTGTG